MELQVVNISRYLAPVYNLLGDPLCLYEKKNKAGRPEFFSVTYIKLGDLKSAKIVIRTESSTENGSFLRQIESEIPAERFDALFNVFCILHQ